MNWFVYILECICEVFIAMSGGTNKPMVTTGEMVTSFDLFVGICGFFFPIILVVVIFCLIKYVRLKKKNSKQKKQDEEITDNKNKNGE